MGPPLVMMVFSKCDSSVCLSRAICSRQALNSWKEIFCEPCNPAKQRH